MRPFPIAAVALAAAIASPARAQQISYDFAGHVVSSTTNGIAVGDSFTATLTYDLTGYTSSSVIS